MRGLDGKRHGESPARLRINHRGAIDTGQAFMDRERIQRLKCQRVGAVLDSQHSQLNAKQARRLLEFDGHFRHAVGRENIGHNLAAESEEFIGGKWRQSHRLTGSDQVAANTLRAGIGKPLQSGDKAEIVKNSGAKFIGNIPKDRAQLQYNAVPLAAFLGPGGGWPSLQRGQRKLEGQKG